ncbi:lipase chaperone [Lysobacter enzymogenes]|uniref:Lipase chaperone n=1 Tax=Lysobacter enzymogenes TaxID=69 RepID=A0A0S2DDF9_LYSEN|nr:lipase secretion chaperone [Lysobacter enzymogenes]ALN56516.1 lipase chaperone [Lysobacter enzymogenes]QCW25332.1 hypothetical protein FE772_06315 [Lysobacter enzymogenes]
MRATALGIAMAIVAVLAIVAVFAVGGLLERPLLSSATVVSSGDGGQLADPDPRAAESRVSTPVAPDRAAAADSLRDTAVDGAATLDALGRPRADRELRRLFDYFLARSGERSPETIRSALALHLHAQLAPPALATVLAWYDAYVALERDSVALAQAAGGAEAGFARVRALRRERLGEELAQAFYAQEEADYELARQRGAARGALLAQQGLDAQARADGLAELDRSAAAEPALQASAQLSDALAQNRRFEREGTDAATRYAQREAQYGAAAAQRLADLDQRRAQWQLRLRSYAAQRQRVLADGGLSETQRRQRLDALLADFDPNERRRVDALARNGGLPGR